MKYVLYAGYALSLTIALSASYRMVKLELDFRRRWGEWCPGVWSYRIGAAVVATAYFAFVVHIFLLGP